MNIQQVMNELNISHHEISEGDITVLSPIDGSLLGKIASTPDENIESIISKSQEAFLLWRKVPAPARGELVRVFGELLRKHKHALGTLVTVECGKSLQEGLGEVQEMIDICDFANGLSRQLYGLTIASERPMHKMQETWHPVGPVGIISAFNFPVAVWSWNMCIAVVCGNTCIWKPSDTTPITALACQKLFLHACELVGNVPDNISQIIQGGAATGERLVQDKRVPIISATGSSAMGKKVGPMVAQRFGKSILELGGNNAVIVTPSADVSLALRGIVFGAVGTAGQRCTTTRRAIIYESILENFRSQLFNAYKNISIGNPLDENKLVGPLINENAFLAMQEALKKARADGGEVIGGERVLESEFPNAFYVQPAIVDMTHKPLTESIQAETFAPILYLYRYSNFENALAIHNNVPQGLSSAIFTNNIQEAETFTSAWGSDCGIANINIGTSGAEIGGAFGGEKETGGGRESGSDAWKAYMRRMTSTTNFSSELPLAQGIKFPQ